MKSILFNALILLGMISITFTACKKDEEPDENTTAAQDNATAENVFADAFARVDEVAKDSSSLNRGNGPDSTGCATITITPSDTTFPKTMTIDFGTGCTDQNNVTRKGKIIAVFSGKYRTAGTTVSISFDNFYVNDTKIEGTKSITNNGRNAGGNLSFTVKVEKAKIFADGKTIEWESTRTNEWIAGENTPGISDDVYSIDGGAKGVNREGHTFEADIIENLIKKIGCRWIVDGKLELKPQGKQSRTIDYGDGDCDNKATVTIGNKTFPITLK